MGQGCVCSLSFPCISDFLVKGLFLICLFVCFHFRLLSPVYTLSLSSWAHSVWFHTFHPGRAHLVIRVILTLMTKWTKSVSRLLMCLFRLQQVSRMRLSSFAPSFFPWLSAVLVPRERWGERCFSVRTVSWRVLKALNVNFSVSNVFVENPCSSFQV